MSNMTKEKGRKWDGKSRVSNETYRQRWNEIFKSKDNKIKNGITKEINRTTNKVC
jgi:hypothetical protein